MFSEDQVYQVCFLNGESTGVNPTLKTSVALYNIARLASIICQADKN